MGGANNWEGRVEIFWNGTWEAITDQTWTVAEAQVACTQLGLHAKGIISLTLEQLVQGSKF